MLFIALCVNALFNLSSAHADSLFNYIAYSKNGIQAECSDYLGKVASGGAIELRDFLIRSPDHQSCALSSRTRISLTRGGIQYDTQRWACVAAPTVEGTGTFSKQVRSSGISFASLNQEMDEASAKLASLSSRDDYTVMNLNPETVRMNPITLFAPAGQTLVINVHGKRVQFEGLGIRLAGGVSADEIIWNFVDAETVIIRHSGINAAEYGRNVGIPGTFLAPRATVYFNDALITGALYAQKIVGRADAPGCSGSVAGQINPGCLIRRSLGLGCMPRQDQSQDQNQRP